jgi:acyl carrier protein
MSGRPRVALRPLAPGDYVPLHEALVEVGEHWRGYSGVPSLERFASELWDGVLENRAIVDAGGANLVGLVTSYNLELRSGLCSLAVVEMPRYLGTGLALLGAGLYLDELFHHWRLRKVYLEVFEDNLTGFRSLLDDGTATCEAVLRNEVKRGEVLCDQHILCISHESWSTGLGATLASLDARSTSRADVVMGPGPFLDALAGEFDQKLTAMEMRLDDLGLDSLEALRLVVHVEDLAGNPPIDPDPPLLTTVADAYAYYLAIVRRGAPVPHRETKST